MYTRTNYGAARQIAEYITIGVCLIMFLGIPMDAEAAGTTGTAFDTPLAILRNIFTGPIAYTAALLGIIVAGAMLVFGGEISDFAKRLIMLVLVIAIIVLAQNVLTGFFAGTAAVVNIP